MNLSKKKILIQRSDRLGDVVLSLPVVEALKAAYPDCQISFLTSPLGKQVCEGHPLIDQVFEVRQAGITSGLIRQLKAQNFDIYINLWDEFRFAFLGFRLGIPIRVGNRARFENRLFFTHIVDVAYDHLFSHEAEFNLKHLVPLGISLTDPIAKLYLNPSLEADIKSIIEKECEQHGLERAVLVCVSTGGSNLPFSDETLLALIPLLVREKWLVILDGFLPVGNPLLAYEDKGVINNLNQTSIKELVAWIANVQGYIGSDTGPTHIAAFLNKPLVEVTTTKSNMPLRWGPLCEDFKIIRNDHLCRELCQWKGCNNKKCSAPMVSAEEILDQFHGLFEGPILYKTMAEKRLAFARTSIRFFWLASSETFQEKSAIAEQLQQQGFMIFVHRVPTLFEMPWFWADCLEKNVLFIFSPHSHWLLKILTKFMYRYMFHYYPPQFIAETVLNHDDADATFLSLFG